MAARPQFAFGNFNVSSYVAIFPILCKTASASMQPWDSILKQFRFRSGQPYPKLHNLRNLNIYGIEFAPSSGTYSRCVVLDGYNAGLLIQDCSFDAPVNSNTSDSGSAIFAAAEFYDSLQISQCQFSNFAYASISAVTIAITRLTAW
jgi:hypothetical protein